MSKKEYQKEWYRQNLDSLRIKRKAYRQATKEKNTEYAKQYRLLNADKVKQYQTIYDAKRSEKRKNDYMLRHYKITLEQKNAMIRQQNGKCKITSCKNLAEDTDHCHATGVVRGILCGSCNKALGLFLDSPTLLRDAAVYLEEGIKCLGEE